MWTFGRKIAAGFAVSFALLALIGIVAYRSVDTLTKTSYAVTHTHAVIEHIAGVLSELKDAETGQRGFVITGDEAYLEPYLSGTTKAPVIVEELKQLTADNPNQTRRIAQLEPLIASKFAELQRTIDARRSLGFEPTEKIVASNQGKKYMDEMRTLLAAMDGEERNLLKERAEEVESAASAARSTILIGTILCLLFVTGAGTLLTRSVTAQVGSAVQHVQQLVGGAAGGRQPAGVGREGVGDGDERDHDDHQRAARDVAADRRERAARGLRRRPDRRRGALGRGDRAAGERGDRRDPAAGRPHRRTTCWSSGRSRSRSARCSRSSPSWRSRRTSSRSTPPSRRPARARRASASPSWRTRSASWPTGWASSTKEIRGLIEDVRGAVNTTVMATETGSKAVDAGTRQFGDVTTSFKQMADLVQTTTDAAREIELSTKQQATAVEQVNVAIANMAQAARETEASSGQTLQTASQLAVLSKELLRLVQPQATA